MKKLKISEIAAQLTAAGGKPVKAETLNKLLMEAGDLVDTRIGKVETKQGGAHGITGELNAYGSWVPLYDDAAAEYVRKLAVKKLGIREATGNQTELPKPETPVFTRKIYYELREKYKTPVVFLEDNYKRWWTYDEGAKNVGALLNVTVSHNKHGEPVLPYIPKMLLQQAQKKLESFGIFYVIYGPSESIFVRASKPAAKLPPVQKQTEPVVQLYSVVTYQFSDHGRTSVETRWLRSAKDFEDVVRVDKFGRKEVIKKLVNQNTEISDVSDFGKALFGRKCNEKIKLHGSEYTILKIEQKEIDEDSEK